MSEHEANQLTIIAIGIAFPLVGIAKLFFAQLMRHNTHTRTRIGDWLVRMFVAVGLAFLCIGIVYDISYAASMQWFGLPLWARWAIRISAVFTATMAFVSTAMLVHYVIPLLKSPLIFDDVEPPETDPGTAVRS